jgi:hypothetical protein
MIEDMAEFRYSEAPRCGACKERASMPKEAAERFASESQGRLVAVACPLGDVWHVVNPAVERRPYSELDIA